MRSTPQSLKAIDGAVSAYLAKCAQIADPDVARFGQLSPTRLLKAQQAKIPHEKSKGLRAGSNPSKRGLIIRGMLTPLDRPSRGLVLRSEDAKESTMIYIRHLGAAPGDIEKDFDAALIRTHAVTLASEALREAQVDLAHVERITTIRRLTASGVISLNSSSRFASDGNSDFQVLWEDGERVLCRRNSHGDDTTLVLAVLPASEHPAPAVLDRLAHEYGLKEELDGAWAVRPLGLIREGGRTMLLLEDPGGEPLEHLLGAPLETDHFLRPAIDITVALGKLHRRGLLHKDIKPANIMVNCADGEVRFTGFGIASRVPRERQAPEPPETIAGILAYMAPEQTGRMNRSIDSRSDLYSLGVTLYQMLTGALPFTAADPLE